MHKSGRKEEEALKKAQRHKGTKGVPTEDLRFFVKVIAH